MKYSIHCFVGDTEVPLADMSDVEIKSSIIDQIIGNIQHRFDKERNNNNMVEFAEEL